MARWHRSPGMKKRDGRPFFANLERASTPDDKGVLGRRECTTKDLPSLFLGSTKDLPSLFFGSSLTTRRILDEAESTTKDLPSLFVGSAKRQRTARAGDYDLSPLRGFRPKGSSGQRVGDKRVDRVFGDELLVAAGVVLVGGG